MQRTETAAPCRVCSRDAYLVDERGAVHLCCARLPDGETDCAPCRAAEAQERDWQTRGKRRSAARAKQAALIAKANE